MFVLEEDLEESIDDEESSNEPVDDVSSEYFETIEAGRDSLKDGFVATGGARSVGGGQC